MLVVAGMLAHSQLIAHAQDTISTSGAIVPDATPETAPRFTVTATHDTILRAGPGVTYAETGILPRGTTAGIVERNAVGTWLRVRVAVGATTVGATDAEATPAVPEAAFEGWAWDGDLVISPETRYSLVPVSALPDADLTAVEDENLAALHAPPVISPISDAMRDVFARGQAAGNQANIAVKVGDSLSADGTYFTPIGNPNVVLGPFDYLAETIQFYAPSGQYPVSAAARIGMTSAGALDTMWSGPLCIGGETPLICEFNLRRPSVALILFGPNDMIALDSDEFREAMRDLVETSLEAGVIPVLSTFSYSEDTPRWRESIDFNHAIIDLAAEYQVPLINLWSAARPLPTYGLEGDYTHMRLSGYTNLQFDANLDARFGATLRNLLAVRMLDAIRRAVGA